MSFSSLTLDPPTPAQRPILSQRSPPAQIQAGNRQAQSPLPSEPTAVDRPSLTQTESTPSSPRAYFCKQEDSEAELSSPDFSPSPWAVSGNCSESDQKDGASVKPALGQPFSVDETNTLPLPSTAEEAQLILEFVRGIRDIRYKEKSLAEDRLRHHVLAVRIYEQELGKAHRKLIAADRDVGRARAAIRRSGIPVFRSRYREETGELSR